MDRFWGTDWPYGPQQPPATDADLRAWEERFGVRLPPTLAAALQVQNGGSVWGTDLLLCPLSEIAPLTGERWAHLWKYDADRAFGEPARLFMFGAYEQFSGSLILDYNVGSEPRVIELWHDMGDELRDHDVGTFDDLMRDARGRCRPT